MGHRLSKIVTRTGDLGTTGLADGSRVGKDSARIDALGAIDELNSVIGLLLAEGIPDDIASELVDIQHDLFDCGGEMAIPGYVAVTAQQVERVEAGVERHNAGLAPLKEFILPGGTRAAAVAHVARTVARRAERAVVHLSNAVAAGGDGTAGAEASAAINPVTLQYLNRLSDYLFVLARVCNQRAQRGDVLWQKGKNR
jgi:cob(I)alamin adenosyltransferase